MKTAKKTALVLAAAGVAVGASAGSALAGDGEGMDGASAKGKAAGSPGIVSGNVIQAPVNLDANVCGNTVNVIGLLNPANGNVCANR
ncbi:chaplin [Streptomyces oceani]|uniref:Chaplin n=1 Tax=Streptomyces oceani TaxID=1075402 RepID=A0A1E7JYP4_9ACTN|nr:chaplin [Streptomyces oceani]OEU96833.1 chaplin [Streptomyces oceani]